jgi:integrase
MMARPRKKERGVIPRVNAKGAQVWYVRLKCEGRMRWFGAFSTQKEASDFYKAAKTDQRRGQFFPEQHQKLGSAKLADVLTAYMAQNRKRTRNEDERFQRFWTERFPNGRLAQITPAVIEQVKQELLCRRVSEKQDRTLTPQTVMHYLKFLRHVLNRAVRDGHLSRNPFAQVTMPKPRTGRLRFLSLEEEQALYDKLPPQYAPWVRFAIVTGLRRTEQFKMKWADVDPVQGVLTLPETKAGNAQYVRLSREALAILETLKRGNTSVWVFPGYPPKRRKRVGPPPDRHVDPFNFYHRVYLPAVKAANLDGVIWHTLRHTFASRLAMAGATENDIASCLRHSSTALVRRYAHLSPSHLSGVMEKVSAFGKPVNLPMPSVAAGEIVAQKPNEEPSQVAENIGAGEGI